MEFNGRGFYNTLLFSSSSSHEKWQIDDYKSYATKDLFKKLQLLGLSIDEALFKKYSENADSPEDLTDILCSDDERTPNHEKSYLIVFELWRRLFPEKESLSIFCDKLDHLIHDYDEENPVADELVKILNELLKIFENLCLSGLSQKETYEIFSSYLAQDLETFIYDFLCDLIEAGEKSLAFEFIFGFYQFLHDKPALDLLKSTINLIENPEDSESVFFNTIAKIFDKKRYNLILDAIYFTYDTGFLKISKTIASQVLSATKGEERKEIIALLDPLKEELQLLTEE